MGAQGYMGEEGLREEGPFFTQQARLGVSEVLALGTWLRVRAGRLHVVHNPK